MAGRSRFEKRLPRFALALCAGGLIAAPQAFAAFELAYVRGPSSGGPETNVALAAAGSALLYGARAEDEPGAAALYDGPSGALQFVLTAAAPPPGIEDGFGGFVAMSARLIVVNAAAQTTIHVFDRDGAPLRTLDASGGALATRGRLIVVGDPNASEDGPDAGAAYVFDARSGNLLRTLAGPGAGAGFGGAVAITGNRIFVGAPGTGVNQGLAGSVSAFNARTGELLWVASAPTPSPGDRFGAALDAHGESLFVGAPYEDTDGPDAGAVHRLRGSDGEVLRRYRNPTGNPDAFGRAVSVGGGVVAVGAPNADSVEDDTGAVHLFRRNGRLLQSLDPDPTTFCASAGTAVAAGDGFVAVGVRDCFGDARVYVYTN